MSRRRADRVRTRTRLLSACLLLVASLNTFGAPSPFTVRDSIELTRIVDPPIEFAQFQAADFDLSPDGKRLAIVTRRGRLETGRNEYALRIFNTEQVATWLRSAKRSGAVQQETAAIFTTSSYRHGIDQVAWLGGSDAVAFIGRNADEPGQLFKYDLRSRELGQLTRHPNDVAAFAISRDGNVVVLSAYEPRDWTERNARGYVVHEDLAFELGTRQASDAVQDVRHYVLNLREGTTQRLALPPDVEPGVLQISRDGRRLVATTQVASVPQQWSRYDFMRQYIEDKDGAIRPWQLDEFEQRFRRPPPWIKQFFLVDLVSGNAQALIDAPTVLVGAPPEAIWSVDEKSVIVTRTYLSLDNPDPEEVTRRQSTPAVVEIDVGTHHAQRVFDHDDRLISGNDAVVLLGVKQQSDGSLVARRRRYQANSEEAAERYVKSNGRWTSAGKVNDSNHPMGPVKFSVVQDMNNAPQIVATDERGRTGRLLELNPQLAELDMGSVSVFDWTDRLGRKFRGGLLLPPHYDSRRPTPLVLQTYGFREDEFLVDGPFWTATAYAARALAAQGLLVLQMPELDGYLPNAGAEAADYGENGRFVVGMEDAVRALGQRFAIDQQRIGIVGFSRTGMQVHYALAFSDLVFGAAVISDCITATPMSYVLQQGLPVPGMREWEDPDFIGAPLWGDGVAAWLTRSPLFQLDRIRTPLRLETIGVGVPPVWETFAILKRHHRPVELVRIPKDAHRLQTPWGRYRSQQGTVDWMTFWLLQREDSDPQKAFQYEEWRMLRRQQQAITDARPPLKVFVPAERVK